MGRASRGYGLPNGALSGRKGQKKPARCGRPGPPAGCRRPAGAYALFLTVSVRPLARAPRVSCGWLTPASGRGLPAPRPPRVASPPWRLPFGVRPHRCAAYVRYPAAKGGGRHPWRPYSTVRPDRLRAVLGTPPENHPEMAANAAMNPSVAPKWPNGEVTVLWLQEATLREPGSRQVESASRIPC